MSVPTVTVEPVAELPDLRESIWDEDIPAACAEDQTGYVWTFLDEVRDPSIVTPGALVVAGDEDASAVAVVVDLVAHPNGTIVHLDLLPGSVDDSLALAKRLQSTA